MIFPRQFPLDDFERASDTPLEAVDREVALYFAWQILMPMRRMCGHALYITAFKQSRGHSPNSVHGKAQAIDVGVAGNDSQKLEALFKWASIYLPSRFGKLIFERDHLHITTPGSQGAHGECWREPKEGEYHLA